MCTALFLLLSGTFLLRKVRIGQKLQSQKQSTFQKSISTYVISELFCILVLTVWLMLSAWADELINNNSGYWTMWWVFYAALFSASFSCISVYQRSPKDVHPRSSGQPPDETGSEAVPMKHSDVQSDAESATHQPPSIEDQFNTSASSL